MEQLRKQIEDPQHCFIKIGDRRVMCHPNGDLQGEPIRFTRLAAERIIRSNDPFMEGWEITRYGYMDFPAK